MKSNFLKKSIKTDDTGKRLISRTTVNKYVFIIAMIIFPMTQFAIFYVYMNFNNIMMAFKGMRTDSSTYWVGLQNFKQALMGIDSRLIFISLKNNVLMFFLTWFIGMPLNIMFGFYLFKKCPGHRVIRIIYMLPSMVSGVVMAMLFMKFVELGLPNMWEEIFGKQLPNLIRNTSSAFGVQVFYTLWLGFATSIIIYSNAMFAIDYSIIEACKIDGANTLQELIRIVIPMIVPTLSTYIITGFAGLFTGSGSLFIFYGLNGVPESTYFMGFYLFRIAMVGDLTAYPLSSAISLMLTLVTIPITLFVRWVMDKIDPMKDEYSAKS